MTVNETAVIKQVSICIRYLDKRKKEIIIIIIPLKFTLSFNTNRSFGRCIKRINPKGKAPCNYSMSVLQVLIGVRRKVCRCFTAHRHFDDDKRTCGARVQEKGEMDVTDVIAIIV